MLPSGSANQADAGTVGRGPDGAVVLVHPVEAREPDAARHEGVHLAVEVGHVPAEHGVCGRGALGHRGDPQRGAVGVDHAREPVRVHDVEPEHRLVERAGAVEVGGGHEGDEAANHAARWQRTAQAESSRPNFAR